MNQQERLNYLVESFKEDSGEYRNLQVGDSEEEKRTVLRSLMNIRMPGSISETVLKIQNEFLTEDAKEKGIVSLDSIPTVKEQYGLRKHMEDYRHESVLLFLLVPDNVCHTASFYFS